ncbi:MAG: hypothetical protein R3A44_26830 [Caldilineaceae bacterium]
MKYTHKFEVRAPLAAVVDFHQRARSMAAITPPPIITQMHHAPEILVDGAEMAFTLWLGPLPIRWRARIEQEHGASFVDRQLSGPFAKWVHRHTFQEVEAGRTTVIDEIEAELKPSWLWKLIGLSMWLNLPVLFAYRGWKTRRLLEKGQMIIKA